MPQLSLSNIVTLIRGLFPNKKVLDKFSEKDTVLNYDGKPIVSGTKLSSNPKNLIKQLPDGLYADPYYGSASIIIDKHEESSLRPLALDSQYYTIQNYKLINMQFTQTNTLLREVLSQGNYYVNFISRTTNSAASIKGNLNDDPFDWDYLFSITNLTIQISIYSVLVCIGKQGSNPINGIWLELLENSNGNYIVDIWRRGFATPYSSTDTGVPYIVPTLSSYFEVRLKRVKEFILIQISYPNKTLVDGFIFNQILDLTKVNLPGTAATMAGTEMFPGFFQEANKHPMHFRIVNASPKNINVKLDPRTTNGLMIANNGLYTPKAAIIDDAAITTTSLWSSDKITKEIAVASDVSLIGDNITTYNNGIYTQGYQGSNGININSSQVIITDLNELSSSFALNSESAYIQTSNLNPSIGSTNVFSLPVIGLDNQINIKNDSIYSYIFIGPSSKRYKYKIKLQIPIGAIGSGFVIGGVYNKSICEDAFVATITRATTTSPNWNINTRIIKTNISENISNILLSGTQLNIMEINIMISRYDDDFMFQVYHVDTEDIAYTYKKTLYMKPTMPGLFLSPSSVSRIFGIKILERHYDDRKISINNSDYNRNSIMIKNDGLYSESKAELISSNSIKVIPSNKITEAIFDKNIKINSFIAFNSLTDLDYTKLNIWKYTKDVDWISRDNDSYMPPNNSVRENLIFSIEDMSKMAMEFELTENSGDGTKEITLGWKYIDNNNFSFLNITLSYVNNLGYYIINYWRRLNGINQQIFFPTNVSISFNTIPGNHYVMYYDDYVSIYNSETNNEIIKHYVPKENLDIIPCLGVYCVDHSSYILRHNYRLKAIGEYTGYSNAEVIVSSVIDNALKSTADGLYVSQSESGASIDDSSISLNSTWSSDKASKEIALSSRISNVSGNITSILEDGIYTPAPPEQFIYDVSNTIHLGEGSNTDTKANQLNIYNNSETQYWSGRYDIDDYMTPISKLPLNDDEYFSLSGGSAPLYFIMNEPSIDYKYKVRLRRQNTNVRFEFILGMDKISQGVNGLFNLVRIELIEWSETSAKGMWLLLIYNRNTLIAEIRNIRLFNTNDPLEIDMIISKEKDAIGITFFSFITNSVSSNIIRKGVFNPTVLFSCGLINTRPLDGHLSLKVLEIYSKDNSLNVTISNKDKNAIIVNDGLYVENNNELISSDSIKINSVNNITEITFLKNKDINSYKSIGLTNLLIEKDQWVYSKETDSISRAPNISTTSSTWRMIYFPFEENKQQGLELQMFKRSLTPTDERIHGGKIPIVGWYYKDKSNWGMFYMTVDDSVLDSQSTIRIIFQILKQTNGINESSNTEIKTAFPAVHLQKFYVLYYDKNIRFYDSETNTEVYTYSVDFSALGFKPCLGIMLADHPEWKVFAKYKIKSLVEDTGYNKPEVILSLIEDNILQETSTGLYVPAPNYIDIPLTEQEIDEIVTLINA